MLDGHSNKAKKMRMSKQIKCVIMLFTVKDPGSRWKTAADRPCKIAKVRLNVGERNDRRWY